MHRYFVIAFFSLSATSLCVNQALAQSNETSLDLTVDGVPDPNYRFFVKTYGGASFLSDKDFDQSGFLGLGVDGEASFDPGWYAGAAIGYRFNDNWSAEIAWEYRTNDFDEAAFSDATVFNDGNYASNIIFLNGYYRFDSLFGNERLRPYVGAGIGFIEEIDIDFENAGGETSFSDDGGIAYQFIAGLEYQVTDRWSLFGEAKYTRVDGLDLDSEDIAGSIQDLDYDPLSLGFGISFSF